MSATARKILYTGAAGGLGLETTLDLLRAGHVVVAVDNHPQKTEALERAAKSAGPGRLVLERLDLADLAGLRRSLETISAREGGFDIVLNNAAVYPAKPFEDFTIEEFQAVQRINVDAGVVCVQVALPHMKARRWGRIVNVSSITLSGGWTHLAPYVASKAALVGLTRAWAREFGPDGITVNCISPGAFPTDAEKIHPDPAGYDRMILKRQSVKRRGSPADIANALKFFISDGASFITGQTLSVDGGWVMH